ncbi:MAG: lipopolysaccharide heptosyltransferase II [Thermodesulfovibrionales bacterium]
MGENILVRGVNWVGDAVMTMPAIRALGKAKADGRLSLLVKPSVAALFEKDPHVDEVILYDDRYGGVYGRMRLARELRGKGFTWAVLLQNAFDAAAIAYLAGIPRRDGYGRDGRSFLLTRPVPYDGQDRRVHHVDYYLELLAALGIPAPRYHPWVYLALEERLRAREALKALRRPVVGVNPGAAYGPAKEWPAEKFAELAGRVAGELGGSVVVFGKEVSDASRKIEGAAQNPGHVLSMAGKTTLRELSALISECDAFVSNDSGPMHLAYAAMTPLVAIFGSTDPCLTGPVGKGSVVVREAADCAPCFERQCPRPRVECMENIAVDDVMGALSGLLPGRRAVFFDRDGTLNEDTGYLNKWDDFKELPYIEDLKLLKDKGFMLVGITNQSGVARGIIEEGFVGEVNQRFMERHGFDAFYHCPHHPDEHCPCRKPSPGMFLEARHDHRIDLKGSYMVGDRESDMAAARAVGARGVFVRTGHDTDAPDADFVVGDLREAVRIILEDMEGK